MILYPAIDLKDGRCVRLRQGDFATNEVFNDDPLQQALDFQTQGATHLHLVDLDGAATGTAKNREIILAIRRQTKLFIEVGGGIRGRQDVETLIAAGINRIILGTLAYDSPELVGQWAADFPNQIAVSLDVMDDKVAIHGWKTITDCLAKDFISLMMKQSINTFIYTEIKNDGMLQGLDVDLYRRLKEAYAINLIASGGVSSLADLGALQAAGVDGAILGKSLYAKRFTLREALEVTSC